VNIQKTIILLTLPLLVLACATTSAAIPTAHPSPIPSPSQTPTQPACTVTAEKSLNLRGAPGADSPVLAWLAPGEVLTILPDPHAGKWIHVRAGNLTGWINSQYCKGITP